MKTITLLFLLVFILAAALPLAAQNAGGKTGDVSPEDFDQLRRAINDSNLDRVKELVMADPRLVNCKDRLQRTPLQHALMNGREKIAEFLISKGARINEKGERGTTPLLDVIESGYEYSYIESTIKLLISKGADVNAGNSNGRTPLHRSHFGLKTIDIMKILIASGANINARDSEGNTPLHSYYKNYEVSSAGPIIEWMIAHKADINARNNNGDTLLHITSFLEPFPRFLIMRGADPLIMNKKGKTILNHIISSDRVFSYYRPYIQLGAALDLPTYKEHGVKLKSLNPSEAALAGIAILFDNLEKKTTPLHLAVKSGTIKNVKELLKNGKDVNSIDELWRTPLYYAPSREIAQCLADRGARMDISDIFAMSPLSHAIYYRRNALADYLLEKGAKQFPTLDGWLPLHYAALRGNVKIAKSLIKQGADIEARDSAGSTPLIISALHGTGEVSELLIMSGADINAKDSSTGMKPLHYASREGHADVVRLLLEKGADMKESVDIRNETMTPLRFAVEEGHKDVIELLLQKGAEVNTVYTFLGAATAKTVLDIATRRYVSHLHDFDAGKYDEIIKLLQKYGGKDAKELKAR
ncbi:MAG: ankyrin repeat domain-containing protein [Candidatus Eremiobacteraeota bacterium]|nr:ankyrin repeat domain-containing protein [Candidatus Eremiobacteraeota bacterium]